MAKDQKSSWVLVWTRQRRVYPLRLSDGKWNCAQLSFFPVLDVGASKSGNATLCSMFNISERWRKNEVGKCCSFVLRSGRSCLF